MKKYFIALNGYTQWEVRWLIFLLAGGGGAASFSGACDAVRQHFFSTTGVHPLKPCLCFEMTTKGLQQS